jgi:hypothetical protein
MKILRVNFQTNHKEKQAGAELCQAQIKLCLAKVGVVFLPQPNQQPKTT